MQPHETQEYWNMIDRAHYYTWCALRGHTLPGNDPITGKPRGRAWREFWDRKESTIAYIALARYWVQQAAVYRLNRTKGGGGDI